MPFANFKFPEGILDASRKEEIIHRTTAMFVEYFGEGVRPYSMVLVEEVNDGGWGRADETRRWKRWVFHPGQNKYC
ncbi:tautomerase family protein [Undibacterium sp. Ji50W]|uniref:tautomerase family protein n=1 Tax=Undibacterium sp. Ji50W TaxID=3413041 RepID=UPI003BF311C3